MGTVEVTVHPVSIPVSNSSLAKMLRIAVAVLLLAVAFGGHVRGPPSAGRNDAVSQVTCPVGQVPLSCRCSRLECDGSRIDYEKRICRVWNFHTAMCPPGYQVGACTYHSAWNHNQKFAVAKVIARGDGCGTDNKCTFHCQVQAICFPKKPCEADYAPAPAM